MFARLLRRWEIPTSMGNHFQVLDGLRGLAILMVILFHGFYVNPTRSSFSSVVRYFIFTGWMGVPVFFVLSGFLISLPFFQRRAENRQFWYQPGYVQRRLAKIVPPFYLSLALFFLMYWFRFYDLNYLQDAIRWAAGLNSYTPPQMNFNGSYWSLMVEAHFYLVLPFCFLFTRGLSLYATGVAICGFLLLVPLALRLWAWPAGVSTLPADMHGTEISFFVQRFPFCVLDFFAFGVAFACLYVDLKSRSKATARLAWLGYCGGVMLVLTLCYWGFACARYGVHDSAQHWSIETFKYLPAASTFLLLFFIFDPDCFGSCIFRSGLLRFFGVISYEWFLFHGPIIVWFRESIGHTEGSIRLYIFKTVLPVILTLMFSVLVYRWFSLPILNRVRDGLKKSET